MKIYRRMKFPLPRNDEEFALLTLWYFGKALSLSRLDCSGREGNIAFVQYEIKEKYNSYHGKGFAYSECSLEGYRSSESFLQPIFGTIYCGGIAESSYGQTRLVGYRNWKRITSWIDNRRHRRTSSPREVFVRLAANVGGGEMARIRDMRRLTSGRGDGAGAVSYAAS